MKFLLTAILAFTVLLVAQAQSEIVTLTTIGYGSNESKAVHDALRNAIEGTFGAFISTKTEMLNDDIIKDEIISLSNGNIQEYDVISSFQLPSGEYTVSVKSTVSIVKLRQFTINKGYEVEFKGGLFAFNIKQQQFNEKAEIQTLQNLRETLNKIADASFDFEIEVFDPVQINDGSGDWLVNIMVMAKLNDLIRDYAQFLKESLSGLSLTSQEVGDYYKLNKSVYPVILCAGLKEPYNFDRKPYSRTYEYNETTRDEYFKFYLGDKPIFGLNYDKDNAKLNKGYYGSQVDSTQLSEKKMKKAFRKFMLGGDYGHDISMEKLHENIKIDMLLYLTQKFDIGLYFLRTNEGLNIVKNMMHYFAHSMQNFEVQNGIADKTFSDYLKTVDSRGRQTYNGEILVSENFRPSLQIKGGHLKTTPLMYASNSLLGQRSSWRSSNGKYVNQYNALGYDAWIEKSKSKAVTTTAGESFRLDEAYDMGLMEIELGKLGNYEVGNTMHNHVRYDKEVDIYYRYSLYYNFPYYSLLSAFGYQNDYSRFLESVVKSTRASSNIYTLLAQREYYESKYGTTDQYLNPILVLSFVKLSDDNKDAAVFLVKDRLTLDEINQISGYQVKRRE